MPSNEKIEEQTVNCQKSIFLYSTSVVMGFPHTILIFSVGSDSLAYHFLQC